jgi:radical SAM protein with 4Fe4S-binding SPASM domain
MLQTIKKKKLFMGLLTREFAKTGPFYVDVDLTRRCNLKCLGCPYQSKELTLSHPRDHSVMDLPVDVFSHMCTELRRMGTQCLILQGGGEPLLHPFIFDIISEAKSHGFTVNLLSNGTLFDRYAVQNLVDTGVDTIKVSLWASSAEQYERNYPGCSRKYFERTIEGLRVLAEMKQGNPRFSPRVILYHVINRNNFRTLNAIVDLAHAMQCDGLHFSPMHNFRKGLEPHMLSKHEETLLCQALPKLKKKLDTISVAHNIDHALMRYKFGNNVARVMPCYVAWFHARIRTDGMIQPCGRCSSDVEFGDIREETFEEIWNGPAIRAFRRKALTCEGLTDLQKSCECDYCYFIRDNYRVHRMFKWFSHFVPS